MLRRLLIPLCLMAGPVFGQSHPVFLSGEPYTSRWAGWKSNYDANPAAPTQLGGQIYKRLKTDADSGARYMDFGQLGAIMYKFSGDSAYIAKAWTQLDAASEAHAGGGFLNRSTVCNNSGLSGNYSREYGWQLVLMYDWMYAGMSAGERTEFLDKLNAMASCVTATGGPAGWAFRALDTDQTGGDYFMLAMLEQATGSYNTTGHGYWTDSTRKLGGFVAAAGDDTTYRRAIRRYAEDFGLGGMWMESTEYNTGTLNIYCVASSILRTSQSPTDNFPELVTLCDSASEVFIHEVTPGINNANSKPYQWGDIQAVRDLHTFYRFETCLSLAGQSAISGSAIADEIQDFCLDYLESSTLSTIDPWPRGFLLFNPDATRGNHTTLGKTYYASGQGVLFSRTGWTTADSLFAVHLPKWMTFSRATGSDQVDHAVAQFGEFQLIKAQKYAITHPLTYGGPSLDSRGSNGLSHGGIAASSLYGFAEYRSVLAPEESTANGYVYATGTQGGSLLRSVYYNMPSTFLQEHTRSFVYLPAWDVVVVHDRSNSKLPATVGTTGYPATLKTWIDSRPRKELYVHSPVAATQGSGYLDWAYDTGLGTRVTHLLPASVARTSENETTVWTGAYYGIGTVAAAEKKFHTIITPSSDQQWDTFLNVWDVYAAGTPATVVVAQDATNKVDCALVTKSTTNRLVCFNALQGQDIPNRTLSGGFGYYTAGVSAILDSVRKRTTSFTLTFTVAGGSTTKAIIADLDTSKSWTYEVNGGGPQALTPSSAGVGVVDTSATGSVTLAIATSGIADLQITTTTLDNADEDVPYSATAVATGGVGPYTWSVSAGALCTGLSLTAASGLISGTPTTAQTCNFTLQVQDSQGSPDTDTQALSITVDAASTPVVIETTTLPNPQVNVAYSQSITCTGGTGPYTITKTAGIFPTGLSLSTPTISGTPTIADETQGFTLRCTDSLSATDDQDYTLTVQFTNNTTAILDLQHVGDTFVAGRYGAPSLPYETNCTVTVAGTGGGSSTSTEGPARRGFVITGLTASTSYDITASCEGIAFVDTDTFTTAATPSGGNRTVPVSLKPAAILSTAARVTVDYDDNPGLSSPASVQNTSCASGCTVNLTIPAGLYYYRWRWQTSSDVDLATSAIQPMVVQ